MKIKASPKYFLTILNLFQDFSTPTNLQIWDDCVIKLHIIVNIKILKVKHRFLVCKDIFLQ